MATNFYASFLPDKLQACAMHTYTHTNMHAYIQTALDIFIGIETHNAH